MSHCDRSECVLRDELWLCSVARRRDGRGECLWQMLGCLILTHMGLNTFKTQRDLTNKQHLLYKHKSTSLSCSIGCVFIFIFWIWDILRWIPVLRSWCYPRLTVRRQVLPAGSLDTARLLEAVSSVCSVFSLMLSPLPLHGEAAPTSWWSWVAAGCLGPSSSIDFWLSVLADSPKKISIRGRERGWWFQRKLA